MSCSSPLKRQNSFPSPRSKNAKKKKIENVSRQTPIHFKYLGDWDEDVKAWYPNLLHRTYFVPSEYLSRVHYEFKKIAGTDVTITQRPVETLPKRSSRALQECHYRDDQTQQRILHCLKKFSQTRSEPMLVILGLEFEDYLANASDTCGLPRPSDLKSDNKHRGDFDVLIIHRNHGVFVGEIKIVGDIFHKMPHRTDEEKEQIVRKKIADELKQLSKGEDMLRYLLSDLQNPPRISKVMMLPNMLRSNLQNVVNKRPEMRRDIIQSLGFKDTSDPLNVCLCSDELSDIKTPFEVTPDVIRNMSLWFDQTVARLGNDPNMSDDLYRDLVRRFAGPATRIKGDLRTHWEAVTATGETFTMSILNPDQEKVLNSQEPLVFITGPPGTGKTLALTLKARLWSCNGGVHLLSTWSGSYAATLSIQHSIHEMNEQKGSSGKVFLHHFDLKEEGMVHEAVSFLVKTAGQGQELCVIADEAYSGSEFSDFCSQLYNSVPKLRLWSASVYRGYRPQCLTEILFTEPLRTPPYITAEVEKSQVIKDKMVLPYEPRTTPAPSWGPGIIRLSHRGPEHVFGEGPVGCPKCGTTLAKKLRELKVGKTGEEGKTPAKHLSFGDVFILTVETSYDDLRDEVKDSDGDTVTPASGMLQGLRSAGVPVMVLEAGDLDGLEKVVKKSDPDMAIATNADSIRGLERKVVVWVQADKEEEMEEDFGRLDAMSRANAQLIIIS